MLQFVGVGESYPIKFGRYELTERLAVGGMAEIFLAKSSGAEGFAKTIVIKRLLPHMANDEQFNAMFIDEAKITGRLSHPKIAQTYELGRHADQLFIAMEFVDGIDVLAMLRECAHRKVRIPVQTAIYIVHEILDALDFAHALTDDNGKPLNIIHRDISPSNVLLSVRGDVKLVDFGIARASEQEHKTQAGTLKGKYGYMSPEQVMDGNLDNRSDLFSVGVVLAEMLTGRRLFAAPNELDVLLMVRDADLRRLDKFGADLDPSVREILNKALEKDRDVRYQNAAEFREDLAEWMFANRFRVAPKDVSEIVNSLYDAAWERKRAQPAPGTPAPAPAPMPVRPKEGVVVGASGLGIPSTVEVEDSLSIPTSEPAMDIEPELEMATSDELDLELGRAGSAVFEHHTVERKISAGNITIESAIASLDLPEPDPASYDFDDKEVTGENVQKRPRRPSTIPPPPPEVAVESLPKPKLEVVEGKPDESGAFSDKPAIKVFYEKATSLSTGLLVTSIGGIKKEIYFKSGSPEFVSSNVAGELFGEYLVRIGVMSAGELAMALAMMPHFGGKLGDTLVGLGLMKPLEVFRHLTLQVQAKLVDVCGWEKGEYQWYQGRTNPREAFPLDLNTFQVLGAGALELPAQSVERWLEENGHKKIVAKTNERISVDQFEIGTIARYTYARIDGSTTLLGALSREPAAKKEKVLRILYLLVHTELSELK